MRWILHIVFIPKGDHSGVLGIMDQDHFLLVKPIPLPLTFLTSKVLESFGYEEASLA
jgi:hypothetical protein